MKLTLIDDWRRAHHLGSVQLSSALAAVFAVGPALFETWRDMPDDLKALLPAGWAHWIATGGFVLVALARITRISRPGDAHDGN